MDEDHHRFRAASANDVKIHSFCHRVDEVYRSIDRTQHTEYHPNSYHRKLFFVRLK